MKYSPSILTIAAASILATVSLATSAICAFDDDHVENLAFVAPSPCGQVILATPGVQICANVIATDPDGDDILLVWNNVPAVGSYTIPPTMFVGPNGSAQALFCFTPSVADVGQQFTVGFAALSLDSLECINCFFTIMVEASLSAELESFTGKAITGNAIELDWTTASEVDNAYFNVYRSDGGFDDAIQINKQAIVALGSPITGADYSQVDRRVTVGNTYNYWLESVDIYGATQLFGPIAVTARGNNPAPTPTPKDLGR